MRPNAPTPPSSERSLADTVELALTVVLVIVVITALIEIFGTRLVAH